MKKNIYKLLSITKHGLSALVLLVSGVTYSQTIYTFSYTGSVQTINLSGGPHLVEMWGANGGDNLTANTGGKGGYSKGSFTVSSPGTYYVYVGGKGIVGLSASGSAPGGFNGGGDAGAYTSSGYAMGSGGGASHLATASGLLSNLSSNQSAVLIVAGGGGGSGSNNGATTLLNMGGNGGGLSGGNGLSGNPTYGGTGGSQTTGGFGNMQNGSFGKGGNNSGSNTGGGGGGGWYGGGAAQWEGSGGGSGYIGGVSSGSTIAVGQPSFVPNPDVSGHGYVIITSLCDVSVGASSNPVCQGSSVTLTTTAINTLSWSASVSTASSIVVTPTSNTTYYVTGTGPNNCVTTAAINLSMTPLPNISHMINPSLLCVGSSATLTGLGAVTYTWSNSTSGITTAVSPSVTTTYTVTGTDAFGCINYNTVSVVVNTNSISVPAATTICQNTKLNISASGAVTYTWNTGWPFSILPVTPSVSTVYSIIGIDANNCVLTNSVAVNVNLAPNVFASSDKDVICKGESVTLTGTGANTYVWNNPTGGSGNGASLTLNLNIDIPYTFSVTGTGANGCTGTATVLVMVEKCSGINEAVEKNLSLSVYPNPTSGLFTIKSEKVTSGTIEIIDFTGKIIFTETIKGNSTELNMSAFAAGVYFVKVKNETSSEVIKLIKN